MLKSNFSKLWSSENISNPSISHAIVSAICRQNSRDNGRTLYRLVTEAAGRYLLIQSPARPDFDLVKTITFETKPIKINLGKTAYGFRLRAHPAKTINKKKLAIVQRDEQEAWINRVLETNGAKLSSLSIKGEGMQRWQHSKNLISAYSVFFEGTIEVLDPSAFEQMLERGLGCRKAFGYGLLTLRRI